MANVSKINLYGTEYDIKDSTARTTAESAQTTANSAKDKTETNTADIAIIKNETVKIAYDTVAETINVTKGIEV